MTLNPDALAKELAFLRRGRATYHPSLMKRLGPQTRALFRINDDDSSNTARGKIRDTVDSLFASSPRDLQLAAVAALSLHPAADQRDLGDRERWLAAQLKCHERTARRRVADAFELLVQMAINRTRRPDDEHGSDGWHVHSTIALLRVDGPAPELTEQRTLLMLRPTDTIVTRFSLPRHLEPNVDSRGLITEVVQGGRIRSTECVADIHFRYVVELPRTIEAGELHTYGIRFRLPTGQPMAPHYAVQPLMPYRSLELTVRFDPARLPLRIWRLSGVPARTIDLPRPDLDTLLPDRLGELRQTFRNLRQGLAYGVRWMPTDG